MFPGKKENDYWPGTMSKQKNDYPKISCEEPILLPVNCYNSCLEKDASKILYFICILFHNK